jgi:hypothetical protein
MAKIDDLIEQFAQDYPNPITHDNGIDREMTDEEKAAWYKFCAEEKIKADKVIAEANAKQAAKQALLEKLGITADEAVLLLS